MIPNDTMASSRTSRLIRRGALEVMADLAVWARMVRLGKVEGLMEGL